MPRRRVLAENSSESHRRNRSSPASVSTTIAAVKSLNQDVMRLGKDVEVEPSSCLSISRLRVLGFSSSGLEMLRASIAGEGDNGEMVLGYIAYSKKANVSQVPAQFLFLITEQFKQEGMSDNEAHAKAASQPWYHVVDGGHLYRALATLAEEIPGTFAGFCWLVTNIPWQPLESLKAIARMSNEMQKTVHFIQFTFGDVIFNLRQIAKQMGQDEGVSVSTQKEVPYCFIQRAVDNYSSGSNYASSTQHTLAAVAVKMSSRIVSVMVEVLNKEFPREAKAIAKRKVKKKAERTLDHRVYRNLMTTQTFRGANVFLKSPKVTDKDRENVTYCLKFVAASTSCYKDVQKKELEEQTRKALLARSACQKFEKVLERGIWPSELSSIKLNLLRTTKMDDEAETNSGNENTILPSLEKTYVFHIGFVAKQRLSQFQRHKDRIDGIPRQAQWRRIETPPVPISVEDIAQPVTSGKVHMGNPRK